MPGGLQIADCRHLSCGRFAPDTRGNLLHAILDLRMVGVILQKGLAMKIRLLAASIFLAAGVPAKADFTVISIQSSGGSYEVSPGHPENSPASYENSSSNYSNASSNFENSSSNFQNSPSNPDNGYNGKNRLLSEYGQYMGFYVLSASGVLNLYSASGRVAYVPSGNKNRSLFLSDGNEWCGRISEAGDKTIIELTPSCLSRFKDQ